MSEIRSFYVEPSAFGEDVTLTGQELRHLSQVLRLKAGDTVQLLDGAGHIATARIDAVSKREAQLHCLETTFTPRPASLPIIALGLSKAVRRGFFLEKAVELGAHEIWLWQGERSQGKLPPEERDSWQAKMIAGIKQSNNAWLPTVRTFPTGIPGVIEAGAQAEHHFLPWEVQEGVPMLTETMLGQAGTSIYVVGPEGGFSEAEITALQKASYQPVSLGARVLRCETAATLCLGLHWWASQQQDHPCAQPTPSSK